MIGENPQKIIETEDEQFNIRRITKSGFSRSRRKLAPEAFLELNDIIWQDFYKEVDYYGYHGHKLLTADGTFLNLPNHPSIPTSKIYTAAFTESGTGRHITAGPRIPRNCVVLRPAIERYPLHRTDEAELVTS